MGQPNTYILIGLYPGFKILLKLAAKYPGRQKEKQGQYLPYCYSSRLWLACKINENYFCIIRKPGTW
jgi:hypothetical protein